VVLLHGATLDHRAWAPQVEALQDHFRLVIPDLRAHGESTGSFDFEAAVRDVFALLDALPAGRVVLVAFTAALLAFLDRTLPPGGAEGEPLSPMVGAAEPH
jgi:hypothetical protein